VQGNLNVSKFGPRLAGAGGFINISQNAKKLVFVGTFTAGQLSVAIENGGLRILKEGKSAKFVREVEHRTFSGPYSIHRGQPVLYFTERCVFKLTADGLELTEIAPGIDIERDILARMEFRPIIRRPSTMDKRVFASGPMGLRDQLLRMPIEQRLSYRPHENLFFVNLEGHSIRSHEDVEQVRRAVEGKLAPLAHKVYAIVNYDNFEIFPDIIDEYSSMVRGLVDRFYSGVTRYTTSSFLRAKLGDALKRREMAPHIFETIEEASTQLDTERKSA
jgi:propionate CoA-transferase